MIEGGGGLRFLSEAPHAILIGGQVSGQKLQRYFAIESGIKGEVNFTHSTGAEFRNNPVMR
jgi:hypothetical protein